MNLTYHCLKMLAPKCRGAPAAVRLLARYRSRRKGIVKIVTRHFDDGDIICAACRQGHLWLVKHFQPPGSANRHPYFNSLPRERFMCDPPLLAAATAGHMDVIEYLLPVLYDANDLPVEVIRSVFLILMREGGNTRAVRRMVDSDLYDMIKHMFEIKASSVQICNLEGGDKLYILKKMFDDEDDFTRYFADQLLESACSQGDIDVAEWIIERRPGLELSIHLSPTVEFFKFASERCTFGDTAIAVCAQNAFYNGNLKLLKYIHSVHEVHVWNQFGRELGSLTLLSEELLREPRTDKGFWEIFSNNDENAWAFVNGENLIELFEWAIEKFEFTPRELTEKGLLCEIHAHALGLEVARWYTNWVAKFDGRDALPSEPSDTLIRNWFVKCVKNFKPIMTKSIAGIHPKIVGAIKKRTIVRAIEEYCKYTESTHKLTPFIQWLACTFGLTRDDLPTEILMSAMKQQDVVLTKYLLENFNF